jgi:hypothetical protein
MKHKWEVHGRDGEVNELYIKFDDEWRIVGWVQGSRPKQKPGCYVYCHWIYDGDYPENKVFETVKQAKRALKAAATIAVVGGWKPNNF